MNEKNTKAIDTVDIEHGSILIFGDWGIGKTHFARNEIFEKFKDSNAVIYIDVRLFDYEEKFSDWLLPQIELLQNNTKKFTDKVKQIASQLPANTLKWGSNKLLSTNFEYKNIDNNDILDATKLIDKNLLLIFDELDRVTPSTLIKVLNFINAMSYVGEKHAESGHNKINIIALGNRIEITNLIDKEYGVKNGDDFIKKYFRHQLNLNMFHYSAIEELLSQWKESEYDEIKKCVYHIKNGIDYDNLNGTEYVSKNVLKNWNVRSIENALIKLKVWKNKYPEIDSGHLAISLLVQIGFMPTDFMVFNGMVNFLPLYTPIGNKSVTIKAKTNGMNMQKLLHLGSNLDIFLSELYDETDWNS